uniref:O-methyltransferase dimerisation domain-containing protein n=1 Tax=Nymphaea colorata TaxID=210225 RepID=A0A5K1CWF3_9MAGN
MDSKEARLRMMYLANLISVPMALHAVVKLSIPDLVWQGGANLPISPKQLAALIQTKFGLATEPDTANLQRILQVKIVSPYRSSRQCSTPMMDLGPRG